MVGTSAVADAGSGVGPGRPTPGNAATVTVSAKEDIAEGVVSLTLTLSDGPGCRT